MSSRKYGNTDDRHVPGIRLRVGAIGSLWFVVWSLTGIAVAQRGADFTAFDARQAGRGGVDVAIAEDAGALLTNPAGLVQTRHAWQVELTLRGFLPSYRYSDALNPGGEEFEEFIPAPAFGVAFDPNPGDAGREGDLRFGLGIYHVAGFRTDLDLVTQDFPAPDGTERSTDYLFTGLHFGVAYAVTDSFYAGLTLSGTYSTLDAREPIELSVLQFQGASPLGVPWGQLLQNQLGIQNVRIDGDLDTDPAFGFMATLGFLWKPSDQVTVGFSWRSPSLQANYRGRADVDITRIFGEPDPVTFPDGFAIGYDAEVLDFHYPQSVGFGVAWTPLDDWRFALDLRWTEWSATHDAIRIALRNGDNPGFNAFVGDDSLEVEDRLQWRDQIGVAVGVEWEFVEGWTARVGAAFQTNPVPEDAANPQAPGFTEIQAGLGLGYACEDFAVDIAWLHAFKETLRVSDSQVSSDLDGSRQSFGADSFLLTFTLFF